MVGNFLLSCSAWETCTCGSRNCWKSGTFFSLDTGFCCKVVVEFVTYCIWFDFYSMWCLNTINVVFIFAFVYCFIYLLPYFCFHVILSIKKVPSIMFLFFFQIRWFRLPLYDLYMQLVSLDFLRFFFSLVEVGIPFVIHGFFWFLAFCVSGFSGAFLAMTLTRLLVNIFCMF